MPAVTPTSWERSTISGLHADAGERVGFKPWPSCRATHPFVEGALALRAEHGFRPDQIAGVLLIGSPQARALVAEPRELKLRPGTVVEAKFSVYVTVALAIEAGLCSTSARSCRSGLPGPTEYTELAERIRFQVDLDPRWVAGGSVRGHDHRRTRARLRGSGSTSRAPGNPISDRQLLAKHLDCMGHAALPLDGAARH